MKLQEALPADCKRMLISLQTLLRRICLKTVLDSTLLTRNLSKGEASPAPWLAILRVVGMPVFCIQVPYGDTNLEAIY